MNIETERVISDFTGFIDGIEARNVASIRQSVSIQVLSMQTSAKLISNIARKLSNHEAISNGFEEVGEQLIARYDSPVENLEKAGELVLSVINNNIDNFKSSQDLKMHTKQFLRAYVEAAEACKVPSLVQQALEIGKTFSRFS